MAKTRKTVGRTITTSVCNGQMLNYATGEFEDYCETLVGEYTPQKATTYFRRIVDDSITINNVEIFNDYYTMPTAEFVRLATKKKEKN